MKGRNGWVAARGQIAWILALLVSTAIVVQLERLELGSRPAVLDTNPLTEGGPAWPLALHEARAQAPDPSSATPIAQASLLLALSLAALQPDADTEMLAAEAAAVIDAIGSLTESDPLVDDVVALTRRVFRRSSYSPEAGQ